MYQENIIQAFSRTNRTFGNDKPVGLIYYYRYLHTMKRNIDEAVQTYSGNKAYMVFVDKLPQNLARFNQIYLDIKELFENEGINDFSHLPENIAVKARFAQKFNELSSILEMIKVQGFSWRKSKYGSITVLLDEERYLVLLQRYKELFNPSTPAGPIIEEPPYDLDPHITELSTGKIDADYINSRFTKYLKVKLNGQSRENIENALQELYKAFALLPEEEQKFARVFIDDVKLGNIIPDNDKTFRDYIIEYIRTAKNDQIHRFAETFGLDEEKLRDLVELHVTESIDEFGRFSQLKATADPQKIKEYFEKESGEPLSIFKAKSKFDNLLRAFILTGGFDL